MRAIFGGALLVDVDGPVAGQKAYYVWTEVIAPKCYTRQGKRIKTHKLYREWKSYSTFRRWHDRHCLDESFVFTHCLNGTDGKIFEPKTCGFFPREMNTQIRRYARGWQDRKLTLLRCRRQLKEIKDGHLRFRVEEQLERI